MIATKPHPPMSDSDIARLRSKIRTGEPDECWPWTGSVTKQGYGTLTIGRKTYSAHRLVFHLEGGVTTAERPHVLHSCDNPPCCNWRHLRAGTHGENMIDCTSRGRRRYHRGENHHNAVLTAEQEATIRSQYTGRRGQIAALAAQFGVHRVTIRRVLRRGGQP